MLKIKLDKVGIDQEDKIIRQTCIKLNKQLSDQESCGDVVFNNIEVSFDKYQTGNICDDSEKIIHIFDLH